MPRQRNSLAAHFEHVFSVLRDQGTGRPKMVLSKVDEDEAAEHGSQGQGQGQGRKTYRPV